MIDLSRRDLVSKSTMANGGGSGGNSHREGATRGLLPEMPASNVKSSYNLFQSIDPKVSKKLVGSITVQEMMDPNKRQDNYGVEGYKLKPALRFDF